MWEGAEIYNEGLAEILDLLVQNLYHPNLFPENATEEYLEALYIKEGFELRIDPESSPLGVGTLSVLHVVSEVTSSLLRSIQRIVKSQTERIDKFDYEEWQERWNSR